jgi:hypothetical protein
LYYDGVFNSHTMRRFRPVTRNAAGAGGEVTLIWGLAEADVISVEAHGAVTISGVARAPHHEVAS